MIKKLLLSMCVCVTLFGGYVTDEVHAAEEDVEESVSYEIDLADVEIGDSIVVYEDDETGVRLVVDVLPAIQSRVNSGTGSWSGGTIPSSIVTLYPHYDDPNYKYQELGFYMTYNGTSKKIVEVYGPTITSYNANISGITTKIVTASPTVSVSAKAQMSWVYKEQYAQTVSCYLRAEVNYKGQFRIAWRIND